MNAAPGLIALLTDFGTQDWYVGMLKGVLLSRCPTARLVDITHEIPPQDVIAGAFTLAAAAPWFPRRTVFLAVVDPGVGSSRAIVAARTPHADFIGPDNGLLTLALQRMKPTALLRLNAPRYWLHEVSHTFQGRDIMAPVAAHLAARGRFSVLGEPLRHLTPLPLPVPQQQGQAVVGHIAHIDTYGNLITNLPGSLIASSAARRRVRLRYQQRAARVVSSYAAGQPNELIAVVGSLGLIELAVRDSSAAWTLGARRGEEVTLIRDRA